MVIMFCEKFRLRDQMRGTSSSLYYLSYSDIFCIELSMSSQLTSLCKYIDLIHRMAKLQINKTKINLNISQSSMFGVANVKIPEIEWDVG